MTTDKSSFAIPSAPTAEEIGIDPILKYFLPNDLQPVSAYFCTLATGLVRNIARSPERTVALRKLLESKDAADRAST